MRSSSWTSLSGISALFHLGLYAPTQRRMCASVGALHGRLACLSSDKISFNRITLSPLVIPAALWASSEASMPSLLGKRDRDERDPHPLHCFGSGLGGYFCCIPASPASEPYRISGQSSLSI